MPRVIWKGSISFGLVTIPVQLFSAVSRRTVRFNQLDAQTGARVRHKRVSSANLAALEIHAPMARCADIDSPTMVVFDLDPGAPATIIECCRVALHIREVLDAVGLAAWAKTSGSKGLQLYMPLNRPHTHDHAASFARAVAQLLEQRMPAEVVSVMKRSLRPNKVFIDWGQNARFKTTIAPYSLRGRDRPTASTPITWNELSDGADGEPLTFTAAEVLERVDELGDLFVPTLTVEQDLPAPSPSG